MTVSSPVVASADAHADAVADPQSLAAARVVDLDLDRAHGDELAGLPRPREVAQRVSAETPGEDGFERGALLAGGARVDIERPRPRRARLVVVVAGGQRDRQARQVGAVRGAVLDQPREDARADPVGRAAARRAVDPAARTDGVAVAGLEVGAPDAPAHGFISPEEMLVMPVQSVIRVAPVAGLRSCAQCPSPTRKARRAGSPSSVSRRADGTASNSPSSASSGSAASCRTGVPTTRRGCRCGRRSSSWSRWCSRASERSSSAGWPGRCSEAVSRRTRTSIARRSASSGACS